MTDTLSATEQLSSSAAWTYLRESPVGRLAVVMGGEPEIFPVNHAVDHGTIVFRTAAGTKLAGATGRAVAYEVDGITPDLTTAWSVVVKGYAREVSRLHESLDSMELPLFPWHGGAKPHIVRIEPESVSGRRFTIVPVPQGHEPRHASDE